MNTQPKSFIGTAILTGLIVAGVALGWQHWAQPESRTSSRWMELADTDQDGRLSQKEYDAISDGVTPMSVLDINKDASIDADELHAFMMEADPVNWFKL